MSGLVPIKGDRKVSGILVPFVDKYWPNMCFFLPTLDLGG